MCVIGRGRGVCEEGGRGVCVREGRGVCIRKEGEVYV